MRWSVEQPVQPMLVIFDCDGVLVDSEPIVLGVLAREMRGLGIEITDSECASEFTGLAQDMAAERIVDRLGSPVPSGWFAGVTCAVDAALRTDVRAVPGIKEVLDQLDIPFCVASNGRPEKVALTLVATGLARYFAGRIFTASDVRRGKPAPDLFLHAAASMGALPGRCLVVEDSEPGMAAARAAGMRVLRYTANNSDLSGAADATFARMADLPPLLRL